MSSAEEVLYAIQDAIDKKTDVLMKIDAERIQLKRQNMNENLRLYEFNTNKSRIHIIERQIDGIETDLRGLRIAEQIAHNVAMNEKLKF